MKKLFTLIAMLALGISSTWATDVPYTLGATDKTSEFRAAESDAYTLTGDGTVSYTFINNVVTTGSNWDNWQLFCTNTSELKTDDDAANTNRYFRLRPDNWEQVVGTNTMTTVTGDYWTNFMTWNDGATVNMTIVRKGSYIYVYAKSTSTASAVYTESFTYQLSDATASTKFFLVNGYHNYITVTAESSSSETTDLPTGQTFQSANVDFRNAITDNVSKGLNNSMTMSATSFVLGYNDGTTDYLTDVLRVGNGSGTVTIPTAQQAGTRDKVTISFDMWFGGLLNGSKASPVVDNGKSEAGFDLIGSDNNRIGGLYMCRYNSVYNYNDFGLDISKITIVGSSSAQNDKICTDANKTSFYITLDYSTGLMSITQSTNGTVKQTISNITMSNTNPLSSFVVKSNYSNSARYCWFDNLIINTTRGDYSAVPTTYTIKYQDADGNGLKEASTGNATFVGNTFTISDDDKATIEKDSHKYLYDATSTGDVTKTAVADAEQNVITLKFKQATEYTYDVNAVDGNGTKIADICNGTAYEGDANTYYLNKVIKVEDKYYTTSVTDFSIDLTDASEKNITYILDNTIVAFEEVGTGADKNCSGGGNTATASKLATSTLSAGDYEAIIYVVSKAGSGSNHRHEAVFVGGTNTVAIADNVDGERALYFNVPSDGTEVYVQGVGTNGNSDNLDYVLIRKANISMSCAAGKLGTFIAPFDVTVPENIKAYSATSTADAVVLTKIAENKATLPACTPVIIYNDSETDLAATTFYGVSTTTATTKTVGALTGMYSAQTVPADSYVLQTQSGTQSFYKLASAATGVANRCYVTANQSAAKMAIVFDDNMPTAVANVEAADAADNGVKKYMKAGQLVIKTAKGMFNAAGQQVK